MGFLLGLPLRLLEAKKDEPHFKGPVYTVDYEEVKDDDKGKE